MCVCVFVCVMAYFQNTPLSMSSFGPDVQMSLSKIRLWNLKHVHRNLSSQKTAWDANVMAWLRAPRLSLPDSLQLLLPDINSRGLWEVESFLGVQVQLSGESNDTLCASQTSDMTKPRGFSLLCSDLWETYWFSFWSPIAFYTVCRVHSEIIWI